MSRLSVLHLVPRGAALAAALLLAAAACGERAARTELAATPPDETRFTRRVLVDGLDEPMQLEFDARGRVWWIQRGGGILRLDESSGTVDSLGTIPVMLSGEAGLIGMLLDRDFERTRWIYAYYSAPGEAREMRLSRFTIPERDGGERIDLASEVVMLRWPWDRASHMGGGMVWDAAGNLYLSTGENSEPTQYNPVHWTTEGGAGQDAQRTAANSNDLRGKILRIRPRADGSYAIPSGNLFPPRTPNARPEIYVMGTRNPWRLSIDSRTGWLHWGDVGPDAGKDSVGIGPMGYDEFNVATSAGNYGWPYVIGYNRAYNAFDEATDQYGPPLDPEHLVNASPNNTGVRELPPARPALLAYPYGVSEEFPVLGSGGRCAGGGPVYRRADRPEAPRPFPAWYEGKWFVTDCVRAWIMVLSPNEERTKVDTIETLLPDEKYATPLDLDFGPSGDLYIVEYAPEGGGRLSKIEYNAGNRAPLVVATADRIAGATPLTVALSARGTVDHDGDRLRYAWVVRRAEAGDSGAQRFEIAEPQLTLREPGTYVAELTATDPAGASGRSEITLVAGNEPPRLALEITAGNRSFWFPGETVAYRAVASDREDGTRSADRLSVVLDYIPAGMTPRELAAAPELAPRASLRHTRALGIMAGSDCALCHAVDRPLVGPSFAEIAARSGGRPGEAERIARKIVAGGSGVYGATPMPPHPGLTPAEATLLAQYVLSVGDTTAAPRPLPPEGRFTTRARPAGSRGSPADAERGSYVLRATYTDGGGNGVPPLTASDAVLLRFPLLAPESADSISEGIVFNESRGDPGFVVNADGSHVAFMGIDLDGIERIEVGALTRFWTWSHFKGGTIEVRLDSADGPLVGEPAPVVPPPPVAATTDESQGAPRASVVLGERLEKPVAVSLSGVGGVHDVFIVFRNAEAGAADALMLLRSIEFVPGARRETSSSGAIPEGFTPLFNGRDLAGWHASRTSHQGTDPDVRVEDGAIVLRQHPYGQGGLLLTDRTYRDFELYLEAKPDWGTNGGIFFRSSESGSAYQIEVVGGGIPGTGNLIGEMLRVTTPARAGGVARAWKTDDWNAFRLRVEGEAPRVTLWINGVRMYDVQAERNDLLADATEGYIALQSHWSATSRPIPDDFEMSGSWKPGAAHRYRNIAIRELP
ncbi:MAG TPA: PQQ-dependent sugar dehydrogenase [Gemmatimonadaceae bacterium]